MNVIVHKKRNHAKYLLRTYLGVILFTKGDILDFMIIPNLYISFLNRNLNLEKFKIGGIRVSNVTISFMLLNIVSFIKYHYLNLSSLPNC